MRELDVEQKWALLTAQFRKLTGKTPDLNGVLFLIGVQELGQGVRSFSKEEKQDLMHIGTCKVLSPSGYFRLEGLDAEGWPHWASEKPLPALSLEEQELFLKMHVIDYAEQELGWALQIGA